MVDPLKTKRDLLLDELSTALDQWYTKELQAIADEERFIKSVLKARSSGASAARANAATGRVLVVDDISSFLAGL